MLIPLQSYSLLGGDFLVLVVAEMVSVSCMFCIICFVCMFGWGLVIVLFGVVVPLLVSIISVPVFFPLLCITGW